MATTDDQDIVILGAGFGGIATARTLARRLPARSKGTITLVDQHHFFLFTPMLTEVAAGELDMRHIINPIRQLSPRVRFIQGRVDAVDLESREVTLVLDEPGGTPVRRTLAADHLVLALGSVSNFHQIEGLREHALTMKSLRDAVVLRNQVSSVLERADADEDPDRRRALLSFVVGGGGFSGVETMAALNDYVRTTLLSYPRLHENDLRMLLVSPDARLLPELSSTLAAYTLRHLRARGVEILLKTSISRVDAGAVELDSGRHVPAATLVWTGGVRPSPLIGVLDCAKGSHGGVIVDPTCAVPGHPGVWALGDCAEVPRAQGGKTYGPTAQNAIRQGALVAQNILAVLAGNSPQPFAYRPMGELALVGRRTGVAQIYGLRFSGLPAWFLWRGVYLSKLPSWSKKVRVGIDWGLDMLFGRDISALPVEESPRTTQQQGLHAPVRLE